MKVLVTGAAGFIGSELVRVLAARNHEVTALVHKWSDTLAFDPEVRTVVGDVTRREVVDGAAKDADSVAHLALPDERAGHKIPEMYPVWMKGTTNLLAAAVERGMRTYVHASGCLATYAHTPGEWVDETYPETLWTPVTRSRGESVDRAKEAHRDHGLNVAIMRPPWVYGRGGSVMEFIVERLRRRRYWVVGDGTNYTGLVHVEDCAQAFALALEKAKGQETFIVADDEPVTLRGASDAIADALGVPRPFGVPAFVARLVLPRSAVDFLTESIRLRNTKVKESLGWSPRYQTLRQGLPSIAQVLAAR